MTQFPTKCDDSALTLADEDLAESEYCAIFNINKKTQGIQAALQTFSEQFSGFARIVQHLGNGGISTLLLVSLSMKDIRIQFIHPSIH